MNQYYSAELSQKVLRGLKESYLKGNYTGGIQIYGYDVVDKKNVINPAEAEIVREIFSKFAAGHTGKSIADNLIARGIRTKTGHYLDEKKIYKMIAKDTIEERIIAMQKQKSELANAILSGDEIGSTALDRETLLKLLG